jgi:hypothetical protein
MYVADSRANADPSAGSTTGITARVSAVVAPAVLALHLVTGQAAARFVCSLGFGAAWTLWGDRTALMASAAAPAICTAFALTLRPVRPVLESAT